MSIVYDNIGKNLSDNFGNEKVIAGIKKDDLSITYMVHKAWELPLIPVFGLLLSKKTYFAILTEEEKMRFIIGIAIGVIITFLLFLSSIRKIYFKDNYFIQENILKIKKKIKLDKYPRIYFKRNMSEYTDSETLITNTFERYYLHIEQGNTLIRLSSKIRNLNILINNFIFKEKDELTDKEWNCSINEEEKFFEECEEYINNKGKIIGVKDNAKNLKIKKGESLSRTLLTIILCVFLVIMIWSVFVNIYEVTIGCLLFNILLIALIALDYDENTLIIKYLKDGKLKVNGYTYDYKKDNIRIFVQRFNLPTEKEKYKYFIIIFSPQKVRKGSLNNVDIEKFKLFLNTLIFSEDVNKG